MRTDAELVLAARAGDDGALAAIYDRYANPIHDFCTGVLRDPHEAADAMQDTFVAAAAALDRLREPAKLRPWLYAIARHEALRRAKRRDRARPVEDVGIDVAASGATPEDEVTGRADAAAASALVWDAAAGLSTRDRALLDLHLRQGLDGAELADAIGATPEHTYVLMSRLRDQVERSIGALLVARQGRAECDELQGLLADWDGTFSPLWRKRVARHVEDCEVCERTKRTVLGLFGAAPAVAAPAGLREPVLAAMRGARSGAARRERGWRDDGFPPPLDPPTHRGRRLVAVAAALVLLVGATAVVVAETGRDADGRGGGNGDRRIEAAARERAVTTTTVVAPTPTPTPTEPPVPETSPPVPVAPGPVPALSPPPAPPGDTTAPVISGVSANPAVITWQQCPPSPHVSTVSATITDDVGIASVTVTVSSTFGTASPAPSGGPVFSVAVGPYLDGPAPTIPITVTFTATDTSGNVAQAQTVVTWQKAC